jgi:hypothetical protein
MRQREGSQQLSAEWLESTILLVAANHAHFMDLCTTLRAILASCLFSPITTRIEAVRKALIKFHGLVLKPVFGNNWFEQCGGHGIPHKVD